MLKKYKKSLLIFNVTLVYFCYALLIAKTITSSDIYYYGKDLSENQACAKALNNAKNKANRSALEEDVIDASKVSESYGKVMVADFVLSLSRKIQDKLAGTGRWHVIKNRFGIDGITYPATINTNIGQVQIFEGSSQFGKDAQSKMNNSEEFLRKELANKYKDFGKNVEGFE